jgi:hypothetical protein
MARRLELVPQLVVEPVVDTYLLQSKVSSCGLLLPWKAWLREIAGSTLAVSISLLLFHLHECCLLTKSEEIPQVLPACFITYCVHVRPFT